jgi:hypothetical protein
MEGYKKLDQYKKADFIKKMGLMYSSGDPDVLEHGIGVNVPDAQKAINLLTEYKVLT